MFDVEQQMLQVVIAWQTTEQNENCKNQAFVNGL